MTMTQTSQRPDSRVTRAARRVIVIGYGSPIRGDDAIGPLVADRLIDEIESDQITVYSRHILTAELVGEVVEASLVIFLDAAANGSPGEILCRAVAPDPGTPMSMAHFLDPRELLAWCDGLYNKTPEAYLITAAGLTFDYSGYELSDTLSESVQPMIDRVQALIDEHLA